MLQLDAVSGVTALQSSDVEITEGFEDVNLSFSVLLARV